VHADVRGELVEGEEIGLRCGRVNTKERCVRKPEKKTVGRALYAVFKFQGEK